MKYLIPIVLIGLLSCKSTQNASDMSNDNVTDDQKPKKNVRIKASIGVSGESDPVTINSARVEGNKMFIVVEYSGGCSQHSFQLIGEEAVLKSLPPKRYVSLIHNANDDHCRALITDTIEADIEALAAKQYAGSEIILILNGYKDELKYTYE